MLIDNILHRQMTYIALLVFLTTLSFSSFSADKIYKWVDEKGKTHYSKTPPKEQKLEKILIKKHKKTGVRMAPKSHTEVIDDIDPNRVKNDTNCRKARTKLMQVKVGPHRANETELRLGEKPLHPEEIKLMSREVQKLVDYYCD